MAPRPSLAFLLFILILPIAVTYAQPVQHTGAPEFVPQMGPDKSCARLAFTPDSRFVVTSGQGRTTLQLWETDSGRLVRNFQTEPARYSSYVFESGELGLSPDGKYVALVIPAQAGGVPPAETNSNLQQWYAPLVWDMSTGYSMIHSDWRWDTSKHTLVNKDVPWTAKEIESWVRSQSQASAKWGAQHQRTHKDEKAFLGTRMALSANGQYFARVEGYGDLWNTRQEREIPGFCASQVLLWKSLALSASGKLMAAASIMGAVWDPSGSSFVVWDLENLSGPRNAKVDGRLQSIAVSPDAKRLATGTREDDRDGKGRLLLAGYTQLWDVASLKQNAPDIEYSETTSSVAFSRDGSRFVSGMITIDTDASGPEGVAYRGLLKMWNPETGKLLWKRVLPDPKLSAVAFSPDGKAVATGHQGILVKLYDASTGKRIRFFNYKQEDTKAFGEESAILALAFSGDGTLLAAGNSIGHLHVWQTHTGKLMAHLSEPVVNIDPGIMYEFGADSEETGGRSLATRESVEAVVFSKDNKQLYSAGCDGTIKVWDVATWKQGSTLSPGTDRCIRTLAISPDGNWLIAAGEDGQILFWDLASRRLSARLLISRDAKSWLVVSGDGHFDGTDGGIRSLAAWRVQDRLVSLDSLPAEFHVKGLLQKILTRQNVGDQTNLPAILAKP